MFANIINVVVWGAIVVTLVSCNIYAPFNSTSSENDIIEEAQKCLHDNDFGCAIEKYEMLPAGELKNQKLCVVYLAKAGFTLSAMVTTVKNNSATMLGSLAEALLPWDETRSSDAAAAKTNCANYAGNAGSGQTGVLLTSLAYLVDCATMIAKSDTLQGANAGDTVCTTAGNGNGRISSADINAGGTPTMCAADAVRCQVDFASLDAAATSLGADLKDIKDAINTTGGAGTIGGAGSAAAARTAIQAAVVP